MATGTKHRARLGDLLIAHGVITAEQLADALDVQQRGQQERLLGEILVDLGYATQEQVLAGVAEACGVPFARLTPQLVDPAVRCALPEAFIQKHGVLPLFRVRDMLTAASSEPSNLFLIDEIAHASGLSVQLVAATAENIYQMLDETRTAGEGAAVTADESADLPVSGELLLSDDYDSVYGAWPPEKVASLLVREAVAARASAIHLEPDEKVLRIRFRIDNRLHVVMRPPVRLAGDLAHAFDGIMGCSGPVPTGQDQRRSARLLVAGRAVQVHLASLASAFGPRTVVRIVRDDEAMKPLEKLGCDFELLAAYRAILAEARGLVLIAGPRESGITTTIYSTLNAVDPVRLNVCTFESCVNFSLPGMNQFSPATCGTPDAESALARLLLQQPDVLALDGVMSPAVATMAVEAALDGRLVLAQVRAVDAADAVASLAAQAPPDAVAMALRGVMAQRVVRTVCLHCRGAGEPPVALRRRVAEAFGPVEQYVKGRGCSSCNRTGYSGQIGIFELVPLSGNLAELVRAGADRESLRAAIRSAGHPSLWTDGINKVRAGITSVEEVMDVLAGCPGGPCAAEPAGPVRH
jgi:type IV pilus assembly protein PilB